MANLHTYKTKMVLSYSPTYTAVLVSLETYPLYSFVF